MSRRTIAIAIAALGLAVLVWAGVVFRRPLEREWRLWQFARAEGEAKKAIADRLVALGVLEPVEDWYIGLLESEDESVRTLAADELGAMRSARAVPALMACLRVALGARIVGPSDVDHLYRALGRIGEPALTALIEELRGPGLPGIFLFQAFEEFDRELTVPVLVELLGDESEKLRAAAERVLALWGSTEAVPGLIETLRDPSVAVRESAARVLLRCAAGAELAPHEPVLIEALGDAGETVRLAGVTLLGGLDGLSEAARDALVASAVDDAAHVVRRAAAQSLARHGPLPERVAARIVDDVMLGYADSLGLRFLADIGPRALPGLLSALASPDPSRRENAVAVVPFISDEARRQAVTPLAELVTNGEPLVRASALMSLALVGEDAAVAVPAVAASLDDADPRVRRAAATALERIRGARADRE